MPPVLRSKGKHTKAELIEHSQALRAGPVNTQGLPSLPTETLLEITSHLPKVGLMNKCRPVLGARYLDRQAALKALSQTCRSLRNVFLPIAWQRIEACASLHVCDDAKQTQTKKYREQDIATDLVECMETVMIREPKLASYVRIVNVAICHYSAKTVFAEFARCLASLPNLHTVQILSGSARSQSRAVRKLLMRGKKLSVGQLLYKAFTGYTFPQVHTVMLLCDSAQGILKCFPQAHKVVCAGLLGSNVVDALSSVCRNVEELYVGNMDLTVKEDQVKIIRKLFNAVPDARVVQIGMPYLTHNLVHLIAKSKMTKLETLELRLSSGADSNRCISDKQEKGLEIARTILKSRRASGDGREICVKVVYPDFQGDVEQ